MSQADISITAPAPDAHADIAHLISCPDPWTTGDRISNEVRTAKHFARTLAFAASNTDLVSEGEALADVAWDIERTLRQVEAAQKILQDRILAIRDTARPGDDGKAKAPGRRPVEAQEATHSTPQEWLRSADELETVKQLARAIIDLALAFESDDGVPIATLGRLIDEAVVRMQDGGRAVPEIDDDADEIEPAAGDVGGANHG